MNQPKRATWILLAILVAASAWSTAEAMPLRPDVRERLLEAAGTSGAAQTQGTTPGLPGLLSPARLSAAGIDAIPKQCRLNWEEREGRTTRLKALVILVQFPNVRADMARHGPVHFQSLLFGKQPWDTRTLENYYLENSYGALDVTGDVYGWYTLPNPSAFYAGGTAGVCEACYPNNAQRMTEDAVELARPFVDFSLYDNDGPDGVPSSGDDDGYVDALFVVHSGSTYEDTGNPALIMSHQWSTHAPLLVDGVYVLVYTAQGESSRLGTFCHEMGHVLGLPDLYDRDYSSYGLDLWSLMASGGWLGEGDTPSHLDAYCKMKLGFVEPVAPEGNVTGITLRPVEEFPDVYKLWKNGLARKEYYLLENRKKTGFDSPLPGSGLFIYHVDETIGDNDTEPRYMVALEQGDGLFELERRVPGEPFAADPGDPFPGWSFNRNFSIFTGPSSRNNDGVDVQVAVTGISDAGGMAAFNATVETTLNAVISRVLTDDGEGGDDDGNADAGETAKLLCEFTNVGLPSGRLYARASTGNIYVTVGGDSVDYDNLGQDEVRLPTDGFTFSVDSALAHDPYRAYFVVTLTDGLSFVQKDTVSAPIGDSLGLRDDFESGQGDWTHGGFGGVDDWHMSAERGHDGPNSWRCGVGGTSTYSGRQDSYLRTPVFISGASTRLAFWQWLDLESAGSETAWDGVFVEVSKDNFYWDRVEPVGGYPYVFDPRVGGENARLGCFSGRSRQWERVEFDLSEYSGTVWVRLRMATDGDVSGEGWYVDGVDVPTFDQPYTIAFGQPSASPGKVDLNWNVVPRLSAYTGTAMTLIKADVSTVSEGEYEQYELIYYDPSTAPGGRTYADTSVVPGHTYSYAIRDVRPSDLGGPWLRVTWWPGPSVYVPHSIRAPALALCTPNPFAPSHGRMTVAVDVPDAGGTPMSKNGRVVVYDMAGRALKVLLEGHLVSGRTTADWDGTDADNEELPAGVYVVSFETGGTQSARKVVLLR